MKNLNFKYISAKNFLCFGPDGIEINFEDYGNIVLIRGNNLDVTDEDGKTSSNGVGKSSILEILSYGLFGKTIKYPKKVSHKDVINNQICKKLEIEVCWDGFRVLRTRKPDGLKFWENKDLFLRQASRGSSGKKCGTASMQKIASFQNLKSIL